MHIYTCKVGVVAEATYTLPTTTVVRYVVRLVDTLFGLQEPNQHLTAGDMTIPVTIELEL